MNEVDAADRSVLDAVPRRVRVTAALSWRALVIVGALALLGWVVGYLAVVTVPIAIALLLSALFVPAVERLVRWRWPRVLATIVTLVVGLAVVGGMFTLVIMMFVAGFPQLQTQIGRSVTEFNEWLRSGPLQLSQVQLDQLVASVSNTITQHQQEITSGALATASTVGDILLGGLLAVFALIFFLHDGGRIWRFLLQAVPVEVRSAVDRAGHRGFGSLVRYVRATVAVAVIDAVGIGVGLAVVGVPLAVPLASLVFLGAFVPVIGSVLAGTIAVVVALATQGVLSALIVLAVVIGVQQLEGHVLQPLLLGHAVRLHPLAVVLAITLGALIAGIAGALLSVPLLAVLNTGIRSLLHDNQPPAPQTPENAVPPG